MRCRRLAKGRRQVFAHDCSQPRVQVLLIAADLSGIGLQECWIPSRLYPLSWKLRLSRIIHSGFDVGHYRCDHKPRQYPYPLSISTKEEKLVYLVTHNVTFSESPKAISKARFRRHSGPTSRKRNAADGLWRLARREPPNLPAAALQFLKRTRHSLRTAPCSEQIGRL